MNGEAINSAEEFVSILSDSGPGEVVKLKVFRERKTIEVELKLGKKT